MLFVESIPSPEHSPVDKLLQTVTSQAEALQNSEIEKINRLPLTIFIWWQSEDINLLNKSSFCSMKSLYINNSAISPVIHRLKLSQNNQTKTPNCIRKVHRNMSNDVFIQSSGCFLA